MLKNKIIIKKILPAFCMFMFILISLAVFGGGKAEAKYEKSASVSEGWQDRNRNFNTEYYYTANVLHKAEMIEGDLIVKIGDPIGFSYKPELTFNGSGSAFDTPYGNWVNEWPNFDQIMKSLESVMNSRESIENYIETYYAKRPDRREYMTTFAKNPDVNMVSENDNIVECIGMKCIAKKSGNVRLGLYINPVQIRQVIFSKIDTGYGIYKWFAKYNEFSLDYLFWWGPINAFIWDITVLPNASCTGVDPANATLCVGDDQLLTADTAKSAVSACSETQKCEYACNSGYKLENGACVLLTSPVVPPVAPPVLIPSSGECGDSGSKSSCKAPTTNLCSSGSLASPVKLVDNKWTWECKGKDGGQSASCSAIKDCSWTEVNP